MNETFADPDLNYLGVCNTPFLLLYKYMIYTL